MIGTVMQSNFFLFLLCSLAVWRCAEAVAVDNGPFHVFLALRKSCKGHPVLCEFITCMYCLSGWISIIVAAWLVWTGLIEMKYAAFWWGSMWGGAMAVHRVVRARD